MDVVAVLDTTVNHMPEVFEYGYEPDVEGHSACGRFTYILAGCTCLAGDVFGEYAFHTPLDIGSRVVFTEMGAYTTVKAHMFNGVNLPSVYALRDDGLLELRRAYEYQDFADRWPKRKPLSGQQRTPSRIGLRTKDHANAIV